MSEYMDTEDEGNYEYTAAKIKAMVESQKRLAGYIERYIRNCANDGAAKRANPTYVQSKIAALNRHFEKFSRQHEIIFNQAFLLDEKDYVEKDQFLFVENLYIDALTELSSWAPAPPSRDSNTQSSAMGTQSGSDIATLQAQQALQFQQILRSATEVQAIPPIPVPKFTGKQIDWDHFKACFEASVINKKTYSQGMKLQYLINSVQDGDAAALLKGFRPDGSNFVAAWQKLCRRYDSRRRRFLHHMAALANLKAVTESSTAKLNELLSDTEEAIQGLRELDADVDAWDHWFYFFVVSKLDKWSRQAWDLSQAGVDGLAPFRDLTKFIENRIEALDPELHVMFNSNQNKSSVLSNNLKNKSFASYNRPKIPVSVNAANIDQSKNKTANSPSCLLCKGNHWLSNCEKFANMTKKDRFDWVKENRLCINCLKKGHYQRDCTARFSCSFCKKRHHSKLHISTPRNDESQSSSSKSIEASSSYKKNLSKSAEDNSISCNTTFVSKKRILATARVIISSPSGAKAEVRALVDPGSERSFVTDRVAKRLNLPTKNVSKEVSFLGGKNRLSVKSEISAVLGSKICSDFRYAFSALVLGELTRVLPAEKITQTHWPHIVGLELADPEFGVPAKVDCILGADVYAAILLSDVVKGPVDTPVAQNTVFGWILTGNSRSVGSDSSGVAAFHVAVVDPLSAQLQKFWEVEELPGSISHRSEEDEFCETLFTSTVTRDPDGRIKVRLPFSQKKNQASFDDSRAIALACLRRSERKRLGSPQLDAAYTQFMEEYLSLAHMEPVGQQALDNSVSNLVAYLPHHAVWRADGNKIRVVFNASQRGGNGMCLNDILLPGPKLQIDIVIVMTLWRFFEYVFTTDIVKMFRQIKVHEDDRHCQRIVWKKLNDSEFVDFVLTTITYGTACAPYLAIRSLIFLADQNENQFPLASEILKHRSYVDDLFGGGDSLDEALQARDQLIASLATAQIPLGKWSANHPDLLQGLGVTGQSEIAVDIEDVVSTLGLKYSKSSDNFFFKVDLPVSPKVVTKRTILSEVSRLFDPMGWLSPFLIQGRILVQDLWLAKLEWDTPVTGDLLDRWSSLRAQMKKISDIRIPRWLRISSGVDWSLHGFADASARAYCATIYLVVPHQSSILICSKTKVAPTKTLSIPRLELCAAVLLVRLIAYMRGHLKNSPTTIWCWTDSKVVLDWLKSPPARWQTFVANRVSEIHTSLPNIEWNHVPTLDNPADCATRGVEVEHLTNWTLWWHGPDWIAKNRENWPNQSAIEVEKSLEVRVHTVQENSIEEKSEKIHIVACLEKHSSFSKIVRITAYCLRWRLAIGKEKSVRNVGELNGREIVSARKAVFRLIQNQFYSKEIALIGAGKPLKNSAIKNLLPFLDENNLLRVGGRLQNAPLSYDEIHPVILSSHSEIVLRMVQQCHRSTLHGGVQLMMSTLLRSFWIPRGHRLVQHVYRKCPVCARYDARTLQQQMAPLPAVRLNPRFPFDATGVDYCGPFPIQFARVRGSGKSKGYVAIFVCMVTRAVHIEVVSDLSTDKFLEAFLRFKSRRGSCSHLYSDNGRNFVGADGELRRLFDKASAFSVKIASQISAWNTQWHFIPPSAPHFGGLWEAAVRSFKHHFKRVVGATVLTFEEMQTLATAIEGCLNSRPLCPMSSESSDLVALTPGHFLCGRPILTVAEPFQQGDADSSLSERYQRITRMRNDFWTRWRKEVLQHHQRRAKWLDTQEQLRVGDVVLLKDELCAPTFWPLARVIKVHPGKDGLVRAATMCTVNSETVERPIVKLVKLPVDPELESFKIEEPNQEAKTAVAET